MFELSLNQIDKYMGTQLVLENVNMNVYEGDFVGLIGANGSGKSTILKLIAGIIELKLFPGSWSPGYDRGWIAKPKNARIAYLDQLPEFQMTVRSVLELAFQEIRGLESQLRSMEAEMGTLEGDALDKLLAAYGKVSEAFQVQGGYEISERFAKVVSGLGFHNDFLERSFESLSGGEKTTVMLGKILLEAPEVLLLDEPTNHLDLHALAWLENYLKQYKGIVIAVSHDRHFLDAANKIVEIEDLTTKVYKGNYSDYLDQKSEALRIQAHQYQEQQKLIENMKGQIQELRQWAMKSDNKKFFQRAQSIQIKLDKMVKIKRPIFERPNMRLDFATQTRTGYETLVFKKVCKTYNNKSLIEDAALTISYGDRVALLGENGSGKTTLIKMLLGQVKPDTGRVKIADSAKVAYLPQNIEFEDEGLTVVDTFRQGKDIGEGKAREYLAKYMFYGKSVFTETSALSGGERIRLKLALLMYEEKNVLILDEPTNHLDIATIETLEKALTTFDGTLLFISHDRYFIKRLATRYLVIHDRQVTAVEDFDAYMVMTSEKKIKPAKERATKKVNIKTVDYEAEILLNEGRLADLEAKMMNLGTDLKALLQLQEEKEGLMNAIEVLYDCL